MMTAVTEKKAENEADVVLRKVLLDLFVESFPRSPAASTATGRPGPCNDARYRDAIEYAVRWVVGEDRNTRHFVIENWAWLRDEATAGHRWSISAHCRVSGFQEWCSKLIEHGWLTTDMIERYRRLLEP